MRPFSISKRNGYALLMVMLIVGVAALVAGSTIRRTYTVSTLNQRAKQYQSAMYAAEAAVEKVYARMRYDYVTGGEAGISNNLSSYRDSIPTTTEDASWSRFQFSNAQGNNNKTYINMISNKTYQVLNGNYSGLSGWRSTYRIVSNAKPLTGMNPVSAGVQEDISVDTIPAFQFVIFYNSQLEFTQCAPLTNRGRVHANGPICLGAPTANTLVFNGTVSTTASILYSNLGGYSSFTAPVYNGTPQTKTSQPTLQLPIGTNNTSAAVREIINLPPSGESSASLMGQQRFFNKAQIVLLVSNLTVTLTVKDGGVSTGTTSNYLYNSVIPSIIERSNLNRALPFVSLTNTFKDWRENKWVMATQIDMGILAKWLLTNSIVTNRYSPVGSGPYPNILYVADFRNLTNLHAVRLTNGVVIPTNGPAGGQPTGLTVATINPLYVWGNYNCPDSTALGTTNTTRIFPASLVSDAITVLSGNWQDSTYSFNGLGSRPAADITINAAIIAGAVYSTGTAAGQWSGGVHNLTRLVEDWNGSGTRKLTLNTSLVNLYDSVRANTQFQNPGVYYQAPNRNFNFDQNFLSAAKLPPGTPTVAVISRSSWTIAPVNTVTYYGP